MKEITRRLYTKPVMLGMAFIMGMALVVGLFVTTNSTAAPSGFPIMAGYDPFETTANGETHHDFSGSPIPANFFGDGSQAFGGVVVLEGVPLSSGSNTDTIIQRHHDVWQAGGSTALTMTGLSLKSTAPITVTYPDHTESWDVHVGLSLFKASTGTMTIHATTFDSTLKVWPRFTFTRGTETRVLDTGGSGLTASQAATSDTAVLESDAEPTATLSPCRAVISDFETFANSTASATATSSCPPLTLSASSPWSPGPCPSNFCKPPLTEAERWARHNASPPGTKPVIKADTVSKVGTSAQ